ncbi:MAG TPA: GntR family transcriptional regulator [Clostridia bacterium]|nr:GntR family transcriptional regulator [Clostridia bacterium]
MVTKTPGGAALYLQVAEEIKNDLSKLRYGEQIPTESELMERYNVSRGTVRQAVNGLVSSGYLYKLLGKGTYRGGGLKAYDVRNVIPSFTHSIIRNGEVPSVSCVTLCSHAADELVAEYLSLPLGEDVWELSRFRGVKNQEPQCFAVAFIPKEAIPHLEAEDLELSIIEMVTKKFGLQIASTTNSMYAVIADRELEAMMGATCGKAVLVSEFIARDRDGRPFLFDKSYDWDSQYKYVIESEYALK